MKLDPDTKALADILVGIAVREIHETARGGQENARTDGHPKRAKGQNNDKGNTTKNLY